MTPVSQDWLPLPDDSLQKALVLRLRSIPLGKISAVARGLVLERGESLEGEEGRKRFQNARRQVGNWRRGKNPDVRLSTVTALAAVLNEPALAVLAYDLEEEKRQISRELREIVKRKHQG